MNNSFSMTLKRNKVLIAVIAVLLAAACVCIYTEAAYVRVTQVIDGEETLLITKKGEVPSLSEPEEKEGKVFTGWIDGDGNEYDGSPVTKNTVLTAAYDEVSHTVTLEVGEATVFTDTVFTVAHNSRIENEQLPDVKLFGADFAGWYRDENCSEEFDMARDRVTEDITLYAKYTYAIDSDESLAAPSIYVITSDYSNNISHDKLKKCLITVDANASGLENIDTVSGSIKGRGNSTWSYYDKKPFLLKFDSKVDLFGLGEAKDWVLLANTVDMSMLRNYTVYKLAQSLDGCRFTTDCVFAHVYINGKYNGLYLVTEQVEAGKNRVDVGKGVDDNGTALAAEDTGFLLECGSTWPSESETSFWPKSFKGISISGVTIKSPKKDVITDEQYNYIKDLANDVTKAIGKKDWEKICSLINMDSFVDCFIANEYVLSGDMGWTFYCYKLPGEGLSMGPLWDFDQSSGISEHGGDRYKGYNGASPLQWFDTLIEMDEFRALVKARWEEKYDVIHSFPDTELNATATLYAADIDKNYEKWDNFLGTKQWRSLPAVDRLKTYPEHVEYFITWLNNRLDWIEKDLGIK